jgi:hypothetical protein
MKKLIIYIICLSIFSCKKSKSETEEDFSLPFKKKWKLIAQIETYSYQSTTVDVFALKPACEQDNYYNFITTASYTYNAGSVKCNVNELDIIESGTWAYISDQTKLILQSNAASTSTPYDVAYIDETVLELRTARSVLAGTIFTTLKYVAIP